LNEINNIILAKKKKYAARPSSDIMQKANSGFVIRLVLAVYVIFSRDK